MKKALTLNQTWTARSIISAPRNAKTNSRITLKNTPLPRKRFNCPLKPCHGPTRLWRITSVAIRKFSTLEEAVVFSFWIFPGCGTNNQFTAASTDLFAVSLLMGLGGIFNHVNQKGAVFVTHFQELHAHAPIRLGDADDGGRLNFPSLQA